MLDRFGSEGFLAAYDAGPQHYAEHLATGRPLPGETEAYVAKMKLLIEVAHRERSRSVLRHAIRCQNAPAFIEPFGSASADDQPASVASLMASSSLSSVAKLMTPLRRRAPQICLTDLGQLGCPAIPVRGRECGSGFLQRGCQNASRQPVCCCCNSCVHFPNNGLAVRGGVRPLRGGGRVLGLALAVRALEGGAAARHDRHQEAARGGDVADRARW